MQINLFRTESPLEFDYCLHFTDEGTEAHQGKVTHQIGPTCPPTGFSCLPRWPEASFPLPTVLPTLELVTPAGHLADCGFGFGGAGGGTRQAHWLNERRRVRAAAVRALLQAHQS